jgi:hypothetical protein
MGKEPWFRNHDYNGKEIRWWFAGLVAISKSRFLSVPIPFRKDRAR